MKTGRLEAFSDGVLAIIITIMVLQLSLPKGSSFAALLPLLPKFFSYLLSFLYVGIYWNNHHHLFQAVERVNGKVLWANLVLLFALSLVPFSTDWVGESGFSNHPVALYGGVLLLAAIAFNILGNIAVRYEGSESKIGLAFRGKKKELMSIALYIAGVALAFLWPLLSMACYTIVAVLWIVPDPRIEKQLK